MALTKDDVRLLPGGGHTLQRGSPQRIDRCSACIELVAASAASCAFDWALHNPYCGLLFRCHCTFPWAGGAAGCNIHHASGPKCPWCNVMSTQLWWLAWAITDRFTIACMILAYVAVWMAQMPGRVGEVRQWMLARSTPRQLLLRAAAGITTFLILGFALALVFYLATDYPCFLWITDGSCGFAASTDRPEAPRASLP